LILIAEQKFKRKGKISRFIYFCNDGLCVESMYHGTQSFGLCAENIYHGT
jgi:hypothetical protein